MITVKSLKQYERACHAWDENVIHKLIVKLRFADCLIGAQNRRLRQAH